MNFFKSVFEHCPGLGWSLIKPILRSFLVKNSAEESEDKKRRESDDFEGSRSNH